MPGRGHRADRDREVLARQPVSDLAPGQVVRSFVEGDRKQDRPFVIEPALVRPRGDDRRERVELQSARRRIDGEHPTRPEPSEPDALPVEVDDAGLRRAHDQPVVGRREPHRPQAVPIQCRSDDETVREHERRRAVPRLHPRLVPSVEGPRVLVDGRVVLPGAGERHRDRVTHVSRFTAGRAVAHEQVDRLVQHRGVRASLVDRGPEQVLELVVSRAEVALARAHPRGVAGERVDLAVMAERAERLRPLPSGRRVRRVPLMEDREPPAAPLVAQVRVEGVELARPHERLVRDGAEAERDHVRVETFGGDVVFEAPADPVCDGRLLRTARRRTDHHLEDRRHRRGGRRAERGGLDRDLPHLERLHAFGSARLLEERGQPALGLPAREHHRHTDRTPLVDRQPELVAEEMPGDRQQHAGAVAGDPVAGGRAPVLEPAQGLDAELDDAPALVAGRIRDEADAARAPLGSRIPARLHERRR